MFFNVYILFSLYTGVVGFGLVGLCVGFALCYIRSTRGECFGMLNTSESELLHVINDIEEKKYI
jgi:hypothetical protein